MLGIYKNKIYEKNGEYFTENYIKMLSEQSGFKEVDPYDLHGKIHCMYNEIFFDDASMLLCNDIIKVDEYLYDNIENGDIITYYDENGEECTCDDDYVEEIFEDIYQFYLIDSYTAEFLKEHTDELIFYSEKLDLYVLGVTHFGTAWAGVCTTIEL